MKELELIIQLVTQLSGDGKEAFFWWLLMDKGLGSITTIAVVIVVSVLIYKAVIRIANASQNDQNLREIRDLVYPDGYSYYSRQDHNTVISILREKFNK